MSDVSNDRFADDQDAGQPIAALSALEYETSPGFLSRVRRKIYRRTAYSQLASFAWHLPRMLLVEFLQLVGDLLNPRGPTKG